MPKKKRSGRSQVEKFARGFAKGFFSPRAVRASLLSFDMQTGESIPGGIKRRAQDEMIFGFVERKKKRRRKRG